MQGCLQECTQRDMSVGIFVGELQANMQTTNTQRLLIHILYKKQSVFAASIHLLFQLLLLFHRLRITWSLSSFSSIRYQCIIPSLS